VLKRSVPAPTAVLKLPSPLLNSENQPNAEFAEPVVTLARALAPSAVLNEPPTVPGSGVSWAASAFGKSTKHAITSGMKNEWHGDCVWFIGRLRFALNDEIVLRMIVFMVCGFLRTFATFGNTQNCVRILLLDADVFC
jgi:hypothetical protein